MPFRVFRFIDLEEFWPIIYRSVYRSLSCSRTVFNLYNCCLEKREGEEGGATTGGAFFRRGLYFLLFEGGGVIRGIRYRDSKIKLRSETERKFGNFY